MKKQLLTLLVASAALLGCKTNEDKAKKAIEKSLSETMHDFKSYESVKFGKLDSTFSAYYDDPSYKKKSNAASLLLDSVNKVHETLQSLIEVNERSAITYSDWYKGSDFDMRERKAIKRNRTNSKILLDSLDRIMIALKQDSAAFKPSFTGYKISHTFRGKNSNGATIINSKDFYLNKGIDSVIKSESTN